MELANTITADAVICTSNEHPALPPALPGRAGFLATYCCELMLISAQPDGLRRNPR